MSQITAEIQTNPTDDEQRAKELQELVRIAQVAAENNQWDALAIWPFCGAAEAV
jgi:hypothetical protein